MNAWLIIIILAIIGYILYKGMKGPEDQQIPQAQYPPRQTSTGRGADYSDRRHQGSLVKSAERQERQGNFEEASRLYLRAGQVFSAAKMKAMGGPQNAGAAVELIQVNSPSRAELITRNLANEFFYKLQQPATSVALLRALGLQDEADAVEVAAGIRQSPDTTSHTMSMESTTSSSAPLVDNVEVSRTSPEVSDKPLSEILSEGHMDEAMASSVEEPEVAPATPGTYPNTLMVATATLDKVCIVSKRPIKAGDQFIYCLNCGEPGLYKFLGEMIKVTGKCPSCKNRLVPGMYDI